MPQLRVSVCLMLMILIPAYCASATTRHALLIGNANYVESPLTNPEADVTDMAAILKQFGFQVSVQFNVDRKTIIQVVQDFGQRLRDGDVGLFYYSGHGVQSNNLNYLLPVQFNIKSEADVEFEAVNVDRILRQMEQANPHGVNLLILDACRNNPYKSYLKGFQEGLAQMQSPVGSLIAYATAPGKVAYGDGTSRNSTYTRYLLAALREIPETNITELFIHVRTKVAEATNYRQIPWESVALMQMFRFADKTFVSPTPTDAGAGAERTKRRVEMKPSQSMGLKLWLDQPCGSTFQAGTKVKIHFQAALSGYVTLYDLDPRGDTSIVFPNKHHRDNLIQANRVYTVPDTDYTYDLLIGNVPGREIIGMIASTDPAYAWTYSQSRPDWLTEAIAYQQWGAASLAENRYETVTCDFQVAVERQ